MAMCRKRVSTDAPLDALLTPPLVTPSPHVAALLAAGYLDEDGVALAPGSYGDLYIKPMEGAASGRGSLDLNYGCEWRRG